MLLISLVLAQTAPPIVNGSTTRDFPQVGALAAHAGGWFSFCSGTLIQSQWVLTAAHCNEAAEEYVQHGYPVSFVWGHDLRTSSGVDGYVRIDEILVHPDYDPQRMEFDVGLLHLKEPATDLDPMPVNREAMDDSWIDRDLDFVGWGVTSDNANNGGIKRTARIPVYDIRSSSVFLAYDNQRNLCSGDSGGAGLEPQENGRHEIAGVNSFVFAVQNGSSGCVGGGSGSTRVDTALEWIEGHVPLDELGFEVAGLDSAYVDTGDPVMPSENGVQPLGCGTGGGAAGWSFIALAWLWRRPRGRESG